MNKNTEKHELILEALQHAQGPMSANEIWEMLRTQGLSIGIATVYRSLKRGVESGALASVELESGSVRYEPAGLDHHHHFVCSSCEKAFDLVGCVSEIERLLPQDFTMARHEILLFGTCSSCGNA